MTIRQMTGSGAGDGSRLTSVSRDVTSPKVVSDDRSIGWIMLSEIELEPAVIRLGSPYFWEH